MDDLPRANPTKGRTLLRLLALLLVAPLIFGIILLVNFPPWQMPAPLGQEIVIYSWIILSTILSPIAFWLIYFRTKDTLNYLWLLFVLPVISFSCPCSWVFLALLFTFVPFD